MNQIKRFKKTQRFRIVSDKVSFYATANQIRYGVGDFYKFNAALQKCLDVLEFERSVNNQAISGLAGTWENINVQIDVA